MFSFDLTVESETASGYCARVAADVVGYSVVSKHGRRFDAASDDGPFLQVAARPQPLLFARIIGMFSTSWRAETRVVEIWPCESETADISVDGDVDADSKGSRQESGKSRCDGRAQPRAAALPIDVDSPAINGLSFLF